MDLDFDLLDQVLDGLQASMDISNTTQHLIDREQDSRFLRLMSDIDQHTNWLLVSIGLDEPVICQLCISQTCSHIADEEVDMYTSVVWDSYQLALYGEQEARCNLDYGLLN